MSALRTPGLTVRLNERLTVTGARPGLTWATTKRGPIRNSGWGREARKTWPWPAVGTAAQRNAAIATHDLIMPRSSAKVRLYRPAGSDSMHSKHRFFDGVQGSTGLP